MRAHLKTEEYLRQLEGKAGLKVTVIREGLYNKSWPLYLRYFDAKGDDREEVVVAGDRKISWTSIGNLGLGTALVLVEDNGKWVGKTFYLSSTKGPRSLAEIAGIVGEEKGRKVKVKVVDREEYVKYYVGRGRDEAAVKWWSTTYTTLERGECLIKDPTLDKLLESIGVKPKPVEETVRESLST
jgi:nucleoside-diphosphate-sugar epimerase